jgi:RNA polymerase sigma factor (sigma-70 family)
MIYYKLEAPEIAMAQRAVRTPDGKYTQLTLEQERAAIAAVVYGREMLTTLEGLRGAGKKGKGKGTAATEQNEAELPALDKWAGALGLSSADLRRRLAMALAAKQVLISSNIPLVYGVVSKHFGSLLRTSKGSGLNMEDLVQEGIMGLSRAAEIYDAERSVRFGTYAWSWVRSYVGEYINLAAHATRVPRYFNTSLNAITRQLREELGRAPTTQEVADAAGVDLRTTGLIYGNAISLNKVMRSGKEIGDLVVGSADDDVSLDWEETAAEAGLGTGLQGDLQSIITSELTVKEAEMLKLRFGLEDGRPRTIVDCAKALLVSRNKANQLLSNGLDKLRKLAEGHSDELVLSKVL